MNGTLELATSPPALTRSRTAAFFELIKPRISSLVLVATAVGFGLAALSSAAGPSPLVLLHVLLATALVAGGANALNQYREAELDAKMVRTAGRPIPSGRLSENEVLLFGGALGVLGVLYMLLYAGALAAAWAALSFSLYVFGYTPLKRISSLSVFVGAVSGALPPVIGWSAGGGRMGWEPFFLFAILFFWQMPHFAAIAWLYREDYARAGFPFLPVIDAGGQRTHMHLVTHSVALLIASLLPVLHGLAGPVYAVGAMILGTGFLAHGVVFVVMRSPWLARRHVIASIVYLPSLFGALLLDRAVAP
jgi:protoheme IX farnesyltransferase